MVNAGGSVEALLTLDISQFQKGITKANEEVTKFKSEMKTNTGNDVFIKLTESIEKTIASIDELTTHIKKIGSQSKTMGSEVKTSMEEVSASAKTASASVNAVGTSMTKASASAKSATTAYQGMGNAMRSLSMIARTVASLFAYDLVLSLASSVRGTIQQKSEMESFQHTMGMTSSEIEAFNSSLDQTISRFGKLSKYNLGETVSSLGVEFNLTNEQMKQAMDITAMLQSEYIRAGRTADEATLAVKDILQGEFVRLSRETGVGKGELMAAGWSGDNTDVTTLLEALEKVAYSRHWDVFAAKATSLSDILQITRSRIQDFGAELLDQFTPAFTFAFNTLIFSIDSFKSAFDSVVEFLHLDGVFDSLYFKLGMVAAVMGIVTLAFVGYRTEMGLMEIANQGFLRSLTAAIFGIKGETLAIQTSTGAKITSLQAIAARITGLEAELVAEMGSKDAILTKILGLKAETVASFDLKTAIAQKVGLVNAETVQERMSALAVKVKSGAISAQSAAIEANTIAQEENLMVQASSLEMLIGHMLGLNMATLAEEGFTVAAIEAAFAEEGAAAAALSWSAANLGLAGSIMAVTASLIVLNPLTLLVTAAVLALTAAIGLMAAASADAADKMGKFNELVDQGDDTIKRNTETVEANREKLDKLNQERASLVEGSPEYISKTNEINQAVKDLANSERQLATATEAVQYARSMQGKFDDFKGTNSANSAEAYAQAMKDAGINTEFATYQSNEFYRQSRYGGDILRETMAGIKKHTDENVDAFKRLQKVMKDSKLSEEVKEGYSQKFMDIDTKGINDYEVMRTSDDMFERFEAWLGWNWGGLEKAWYEFTLNIETWYAGIPDWLNSVGQGVVDAFSGFGQWISDGWSYITGGLKEWLDGIEPWLDEYVSKPITDWIKGFAEDPVGYIGEAFDNWSIIGFILQSLGVDDPFATVSEWFNSNVVQPISQWIQGFKEDPSAYIGNLLEGGATWVLKMLGLDDTTAQLVIDSIKYLFDLITGNTSDSANEAGERLGDIFGWGIQVAISRIPVVGKVLEMLGVIDTTYPTANSKGDKVGSEIKDGVGDGVDGTSDEVQDEMDDIQRILEAASKSGNPIAVAAGAVGSVIYSMVRGGLGRNSPGLAAHEVEAEGQDIAMFIDKSIPVVAKSAYNLGSAMVDGVVPSLSALSDAVQNSSVELDASVNAGAIAQYKDDANLAERIAQTITSDSALAFSGLGDEVGATFDQMGTDMVTAYNSMGTTQTTLLNNMKNTNTTAYKNIQTQTTSSLTNMRDSTANVTKQMTDSWVLMKNNIVTAANQLKTQSNTHFNQLSSTIGSFYRKLQNPAQWGAGDPTPTRYHNATRGRRGIRAVNNALNFAGSPSTTPSRGYAGGMPNLPRTMNLDKLLETIDFDSSIYPESILSQNVNTREFLESIDGSFGGWSNWKDKHYSHIKDTSGVWDMRGPAIMGSIDTGLAFKVKEFYDGKPQISFDSFRKMAEALFTAIPYDFYMNSDKTGDWVSALATGSVNCWDGAHALLALANTCGFSGHIESGMWGKWPHVYPVINGMKMDTTGWQQRRSWAGYSGPAPTGKYGGNTHNQTNNVTVVIEGDVYGVDDLEEKIQEGVQKGLQEHVNVSIVAGV